MRTISILLFLLNIIFIGKYLSTALTKWNLFNMRYAICIERLRREQKCGDWTTSQFIACLCEREILSITQMSVASVRECLEVACEVASQSVSFLGSKGMIDAK